MDTKSTMILADDLALSQDKLVSGQQALDTERIYCEIDALGVLKHPIKDYLKMSQDEYYSTESDGKLTLLSQGQPLSKVHDRILANHLDGFANQGKLNISYNHENPFEDGMYQRAADFRVLLYGLKVIGAARIVEPEALKQVLSPDAVLSLGLATAALAQN